MKKKKEKIRSLLVDKDHHLLRVLRIIIVEKLSSKELYSLLISAKDNLPTSQEYFYNFQILNYLA